MAKYLHYYETLSEFQQDYAGVSPLTAFTVQTGSALSFTGCNSFNSDATSPFDGKRFVYDRVMSSVTMDNCAGDQQLTTDIMVFKNGNDELYSPQFVYPGGKKWMHENGQIYYVQDLSSVTQAGDYVLYITSPEYSESPYHEPWVSYTEEDSSATRITGFTSNVQSSEGMDLSGVFTYYGHAYQYYLDSGTGTYKQTTNYHHIWTNGKTYVATSGGLMPSTDSSINRLGATDGGIWTPGKMLTNVTGNNTRKVSEEYTEDVPVKKVAYNKHAVYITWDGTYDTETYGVNIPNYVVDNTRSTKNIFTERFDVYVNGQLDTEWLMGRKEIPILGDCTYYMVIYQSDSDGLLHCGVQVDCMQW